MMYLVPLILVAGISIGGELKPRPSTANYLPSARPLSGSNDPPKAICMPTDMVANHLCSMPRPNSNSNKLRNRSHKSVDLRSESLQEATTLPF